MLVLTDEDVNKVLRMSEAIEVVEKAFLELNEGTAEQPQRIVMELKEKKGAILIMSSYLTKESVLSAKLVTIYGENHKRNLPTLQSIVLLCDPDTGVIQSLMNGKYITAVRTGAASGVATKYLARKGSRTCGIIGAGAQAWTQLWAVLEVSDVDLVIVYDIIYDKAKSFADRAAERFKIKASVAESPEEASSSADILITATTSRTPVIKGDWIKRGTHINSVGWMGPKSREIDSKTISISKIVVDKREAALSEVGDFTIPLSEGAIPRDPIYAELGELIAGEKAGRTDEDEITLWRSVGQAIQDAAVAKLAYINALKEGLGKRIDV